MGQCAVKGCGFSCINKSDYCKRHTCANSECRNATIPNSYYCRQHHCPICGDMTNNKYCWRHECVVDGCHRLTGGSEVFCEKHECDNCFGECEKNSEYCVKCDEGIDKCLVEGCHNIRTNSAVCETHRCKSEGRCHKMVSPTQKTCKACSCIICDLPRLENTHTCSEHECGIIGCKRVAPLNNLCEYHEEYGV